MRPLWRENVSARELFKNYLAGTFSKNISRELLKIHLAGTISWQEHFWQEVFLLIIRKLNKILLFKNKGSETQP